MRFLAVPHSDSVLLIECDYPLSLSSCTKLSSLHLNGIHLFLDEPLGPALRHLTSTFPAGEDREIPRSVNVCFTLDVGPTWESRINGIDWDTAETALATLESRLLNEMDHWSIVIRVDTAYLVVSEDEERRILDVTGQKFERFASALRIDIR